MSLPRRTPLARSKRPMRRQSAKRRAERDAAQPTVDAVFERDGGCVLRTRLDLAGPCWGGPTPHHLAKAWRGVDWRPCNIVTLCCRHNGWVEDNPILALDAGLVVSDGDLHTDAWERMRLCELAVGPQDIGEAS